jgi:hypothetical protein
VGIVRSTSFISTSPFEQHYGLLEMSGKGSRGWEVSAAAPTPATESGTPEQSEIESFITGTEQQIIKHSFWLCFWFTMLILGIILSPLKSYRKLFPI